MVKGRKRAALKHTQKCYDFQDGEHNVNSTSICHICNYILQVFSIPIIFYDNSNESSKIILPTKIRQQKSKIPRKKWFHSSLNN